MDNCIGLHNINEKMYFMNTSVEVIKVIKQFQVARVRSIMTGQEFMVDIKSLSREMDLTNTILLGR